VQPFVLPNKNEELDMNQLMNEHVEHLLDYEDIESSCAVSSQLLGSFFHGLNWKIIYGSYGNHNFFHSWIETPTGILDPTRFQFLTNKSEIDYYKNSECTPYGEYILSVQDQWIFELTEPCYKKIVEIEPLFDYSEGTYMDFLKKVRHTEVYKKFGWRHSLLKDDTISFVNHLDNKGLRIGKKHFRRFAVCSK
jgi:hypothetical protein